MFYDKEVMNFKNFKDQDTSFHQHNSIKELKFSDLLADRLQVANAMSSFTQQNNNIKLYWNGTKLTTFLCKNYTAIIPSHAIE